MENTKGICILFVFRIVRKDVNDMKSYLDSNNLQERKYYRAYCKILHQLEEQHVHIGCAKDLIQYVNEHHCENKFDFPKGYTQFVQDVQTGLYDNTHQRRSEQIQMCDLLFQEYGVRTHRDLIKKWDMDGVPFGVEFLEGSYEKFKKAVEDGYYDYDDTKWVTPVLSDTEILYRRFGVHSYRDLIKKVDELGFVAVFGTVKERFKEGSYEAFRQAVLEGKYDV